MQQLQTQHVSEERINKIKEALAYYLIPQRYMKESTSPYQFDNIVIPMFLLALEDTIHLEPYIQQHRLATKEAQSYLSHRKGIIESLLLFYDLTKGVDRVGMYVYIMASLHTTYKNLPEEAK